MTSTAVDDQLCAELAGRLSRFKGPSTQERLLEAIRRATKRASSRGATPEMLTRVLEDWLTNSDRYRAECGSQGTALTVLAIHLGHEVERPWRRRAVVVAQWLTEHWTAASAVTVVVSAAAARLAYNRFYGFFGLTPEDVGVDTYRILAGTAPGVVLLTGVLCVGFAFASLPVTALRSAVRQRRVNAASQQSPLDVVVVLAATASLVVAVPAALYYGSSVLLAAFLDAGVTSDLGALYLGAVTGGVGGLLGSFLALGIRHAAVAFGMSRRGVRPYVMLERSSFVTSALGAVPTVLALVLLALPVNAGGRAADVRRGEPVAQAALLGVPLIGFSVPQVGVVTDRTNSLPRDVCLMLLGQDDQTTKLYDVSAGSVYRVPNGDVVLATGVLATACRR